MSHAKGLIILVMFLYMIAGLQGYVAAYLSCICQRF